ncbi:MAG: putative holin-like toxin [Sporolactobacillus sp.]
MTVFQALTLMISFAVLVLMLSNRKNDPLHMIEANPFTFH